MAIEMGYYDPPLGEGMEAEADVEACPGGRAGAGTPFI